MELGKHLKEDGATFRNDPPANIYPIESSASERIKGYKSDPKADDPSGKTG